MNVSIRLLGGFDVVVDGVPVSAWRRRSSAALVKLLALQPGRRLRREQVIDALWPDLLLQEAAPRLHTAAHYARTALGRRDAVVLAAETVSLLPGMSVAVDAVEFDRAAEAALAEGRPESAAAALELHRGDLLPEDPYDAWTAEARDRQRLHHVQLLRLAGRWHELVAAEPLDEQAHLQLVREHVRAGRRSAALRQLAVLEGHLQRELGVPLGAAAEALRDQVLALPLETDDAAADPFPSATPIPAALTPTLGRDRDLARVLASLDRARIVTLLGPGGVGKTRLAIEAARCRSELARVQACFIDLTRVSEPALVPELINGELGLRPGPDCCTEGALVEALRRRSLLLVLDNFEHVVDAAALVSRLVAQVPGLQVLCTSRTRLHVAGEQIHDVAPLPVGRTPRHGRSGGEVAPAVALFEQTATAADPDFRLESHLADVVAICRSVDGLPLAIELAAGHVRTLPPAQLRARLHARLGSAAGAARDLPARQRTVPATIDWSLQLLGPAERRLFSRLGVFAGPVPVEAVEGVCDGDPGGNGHGDVVGTLSRLVDQSLVQRVPGRAGEPRFRLLALLRERARTLLAPDEADRLRSRHAGYVAAAVEDIDERRWTGTEPWLDRINDLLPEIRAAHAEAECRGDWTTAARITAALGTFWHREGHHSEGRRWVTEALRHRDGLDDLLLARLSIAAGLVTWTADIRQARDHWTRSITLCRRLGHDRYLAYSLALTSVTHVGDEAAHASAIALCDEGLALARQVGELPLIAQALNIKGELARVHGDDEVARTAYEEGRELAATARDDAHLSMFLANLSYLATHRGDFAHARRLQHEALALCWSQGRRMLSAWSVSELAGPELGLGRPQLAARLIGAADEALRALAVTRHPGDRPEHEMVVAALRTTLGTREFDRLRAEGARLSLDEAVALALSGKERVRIPRPREPALLARS